MIQISSGVGFHRLAGIFQIRMQVTGRRPRMSGIVDGMVQNTVNHFIVHVIILLYFLTQITGMRYALLYEKRVGLFTL